MLPGRTIHSRPRPAKGFRVCSWLAHDALPRRSQTFERIRPVCFVWTKCDHLKPFALDVCEGQRKEAHPASQSHSGNARPAAAPDQRPQAVSESALGIAWARAFCQNAPADCPCRCWMPTLRQLPVLRLAQTKAAWFWHGPSAKERACFAVPTIDQIMIGLVVVRHQAAVAGRDKRCHSHRADRHKTWEVDRNRNVQMHHAQRPCDAETGIRSKSRVRTPAPPSSPRTKESRCARHAWASVRRGFPLLPVGRLLRFRAIAHAESSPVQPGTYQRNRV